MRALRLALFASTLLAALSTPAAAQKATTIGFEVDCNGAPTPGTFNGVTGLKQVSGSLYAPCGLASIASAGTSGMQQLAQSGGGLFGNIRNVTGQVALAGAFDFSAILSSSFASVVVVFSPPINELSFDALDLDNANGLTISLADAQGAAIGPDEKPMAQDKTVHYARSSSTPIQRLTVSYQPAFALLSGDGWFIDQLHFNAWLCGDGELEAGAGEACDDGNAVQCDACNNKCQTSNAGCFDGTSCLAGGVTAGCVTCNLAVAPTPGGDIPVSPLPMGSACDDKQFCTVGDSCDGAGVCKATPNNCSDGIVCTIDRCDEVSKSCLHPVELKWCLIGSTCYANGAVNPGNACQVCTSELSNSAWDHKAAGMQCSDPACSNGMQIPASTCDGSGACIAGVPAACPLGMCATPQSCEALCSSDQNCAQRAHCLASTMMCMTDLPPASPCTRNAECGSDFCVDGVCCDKACNGGCEACNQDGKTGTCAPLPLLSVDPENRCAAGQVCSLEGQCVSPPPPPPPPVMMPVTPVDVRPMGTGCDRNEVCGSGVCKDGVCCDRACDGVCEACNVPGQPAGLCLPFPLGQDPEHECGGSGAVCSGESACTRYETRGNGLCALAPRAGKHEALLGSLSLCLAALALRLRRGRRGAERKRA